MKKYITLNEMENVIEVRREPHIYAFSTNTVPNYIKVGDTSRTIEKRLTEWKDLFSDLERVFPDIENEEEALAKVNKDIYFRDYALHTYLTNKGYNRLDKKKFYNLFGENIYFSNEFFENVSTEEIKHGIQEIKKGYEQKNPNYLYYKLKDKNVIDKHWNNDKDWKLRDNQEKVVENFCEKIKTQKELLMYAVMRFGKSFTALSCAARNNFKKVLIVSAKADVANEWKKTVEMPKCFKEYAFLCDRNFVENPNIIDEILSNKNNDEFKNKNAVAVFLTLQNLTGSGKESGEIKEKLKNIYKTYFDMIIIDETHFGAWAATYGMPLKRDKNDDEEDFAVINSEINEFKKLEEETKKLKSDIKLHLSGTPYNLLYRDEFNQKNMIASCQFSDILNDKEKWLKEHKKDIDSGTINPETAFPYEEYDNPYFGFPKMLRFAFNIPQETQQILEKASKNGNKWTLNDLFLTDKGDDTKFIYEKEVLNLLKIIDGKNTDKKILSFLNIPKIKENDVCKHIVMVLPYKYSCDAMENLLLNNKNDFINLKNYKVLNITGHKLTSQLDSVDKVKATIKQCEQNGIKTITLTVNKMLTGVTVPEWDTMIMLKNTKSPQEYDQAIFRIQNQYVKEIEAEDKNGKKYVTKIDMKPQTILVDFDPVRMFELQGISIKIAGDVTNQNYDFEKVLNKELEYFPIITNNADRLVQVNPTDIIKIISDYNKNISIMEASNKVELDEKMLSDTMFYNFICRLSEKGISSNMKGRMYNSDKISDMNIEGLFDGKTDSDKDREDIYENNNLKTEENISDNKSELKKLRKNYKNFIALLMFYSFLTKSNITSLKDIVKSITEESIYKDENLRIFKNLNLDLNYIKLHIEKCRRAFAFDIDRHLEQANLLSKEEDLSEEERVNNALKKFSRISEAEIVTPNNICHDMYLNIGKDKLLQIVNGGGRILDIASKTAEFTVALYNLLKNDTEIEKIKNSMYCIPTSSLTYEFTRKIYEILKFPISHIADPEKLNAFKLLDKKIIKKDGKPSKKIDYEKICDILTQDKTFSDININDTVIKGDKKVKFDAVVGNPPYQETISNNDSNRSLSKQMFPEFIKITIKLNPKYSSLITPSRWFTGEAQDGSFISLRKFVREHNHFVNIFNYSIASNVFNNVWIAGGVNYYLYDRDYSGKVDFYACNNIKKEKQTRDLFEDGLDIVINSGENYAILQKVKKESFVSLTTITKGRNAFGITGKNAKSVSEATYFDGAYELRCAYEEIRYVKKDIITKNLDIANKWKVFISKGNGGAGTLGDEKQVAILGKPYLGKAKSVCTDSLIPIGCFDSETEALHLQKYIKTKFLRYIVGILKVSQNVYQNVYQFVPLQDFTDNSDIDWSKSITNLDQEANAKYECKTINEIDSQLYKKYNFTKEEVQFIESMIKPME